MSFGRALWKIPNRLRNRSYRGVRATPVTRMTSSRITLMKMPRMISPSGAPPAARIAVMTAAIPGTISQMSGSIQTRLERAIIGSPWNSIRPAVGS